MLRLFVAIEIPHEIRSRMNDVITELKTTEADVRWEAMEKLHITLKFLGSTGEDQVPQLTELLDRVAQEFEPFDVRYGTLGRFPPKGQPRVIWIGLTHGGEMLASMATSVDKRLTRLGYAPEDRPFHPHVTIGRVKGTRNTARLLRKIESLTFESQPIRVTHISLIRSELKPSGSMYTPLSRFPLQTVEQEPT